MLGVVMNLEQIKINSTFKARRAVLMEAVRAEYKGMVGDIDFKILDLHARTYFRASVFVAREHEFEIYKHLCRILGETQTKSGHAADIVIWEATRYKYDGTGERVKALENYTAFEY